MGGKLVKETNYFFAAKGLRILSGQTRGLENRKSQHNNDKKELINAVHLGRPYGETIDYSPFAMEFGRRWLPCALLS